MQTLNLQCLTFSNCVVDVEPQMAAFDRVERVETGLEVGQDNLGVDALEEDAKREERPGM